MKWNSKSKYACAVEFKANETQEDFRIENIQDRSCRNEPLEERGIDCIIEKYDVLPLRVQKPPSIFPFAFLHRASPYFTSVVTLDPAKFPPGSSIVAFFPFTATCSVSGTFSGFEAVTFHPLATCRTSNKQE